MVYLIFILLFILFYFLNVAFSENFINNSCNTFFKNKTFCTFDINSNQCKCTYQKDGVNIPYQGPANCCNEICRNKSKEQCNKSIENKEGKYYCNINGKCIEYKGTIMNSHISANNCGTDQLNNQLLLPFTSKQNCEGSLSPCDNFNKNNLSTDEKKSQCLKNVNCGFCTNNYGFGKCIDGTAEGPTNIVKYQQCVVNPSSGNKFKYEYGDFLFY
jgi:hypothetical protein